MKKFKKALRLLGLVVLIMLALCGISITGPFLPVERRRYLDKEIRTEQVDEQGKEEVKNW